MTVTYATTERENKANKKNTTEKVGACLCCLKIMEREGKKKKENNNNEYQEREKMITGDLSCSHVQSGPVIAAHSLHVHH